MASKLSITSNVSITLFTAATILGLIAFRRYRVRSWGRCCKNKKSLKGQVVIITGANSGLGKATAFELAARGATLVLACRDVQKGQVVLREILRCVPSCSPEKVSVLHLDLSSFHSVRQFVAEFRRIHHSLNILVNNAGIMGCPFSMTADEVESQMSVNHYAPFLLTNLLVEDLKRCAPSRIVFVTSMLAKKGTISLNNPVPSNFSSRQAYSNSKLANIIYALELNNRLGPNAGIGVYLVSPGHVWTNLGRHVKPSFWKIILLLPVLIPLTYLFVRTPNEGCQSIVYCAVEDGLEPGGFYRNCCKSVLHKDINKNIHMAANLWKHSEAITERNSA